MNLSNVPTGLWEKINKTWFMIIFIYQTVFIKCKIF